MNPQSVKIARKRGAEEHEPPDTLIVKEQSDTEVRYIRQQSNNSNKRRNISTQAVGSAESVSSSQPSRPKQDAKTRVFQLQRQDLDEARGVGNRRKNRVATFVERREAERSIAHSSSGLRPGDETEQQAVSAEAERPLKRPSTRSQKRGEADKEKTFGPQAQEDQAQMEVLSQYLHEIALDEIEREKERNATKEIELQQKRSAAKVTAPRISGQRAKEMHRQRLESNRQLEQISKVGTAHGDDVEMSDAGDYIYDTYVLAAAPTVRGSDFDSMSPHSSDVGYLVILPEDQDVWEAYIDELRTASSDEDGDSEDADENAEDHYGADYPEDELSEDDEFGRRTYRRGDESEGSAYESDDAAAWSDDEMSKEDAEAARMMNPFRYYGVGAGGVGGEREGS